MNEYKCVRHNLHPSRLNGIISYYMNRLFEYHHIPTTNLLICDFTTCRLPRAAEDNVLGGDFFGLPQLITGALHFADASAFGKCRAGREGGDCRPGTL